MLNQSKFGLKASHGISKPSVLQNVISVSLNFLELRIYTLVMIFPKRDLLASVSNNNYESSKRTDVILKLKISSEMAYRVIDEFNEDEVERSSDDGSFIVTVTWPEDEWVYGTILSYGEFIEVLEPLHIRQLVRDKAKKFYERNL